MNSSSNSANEEEYRGYGLWIPEHHENIKSDFPEINDVQKLMDDVRRVINEWFEERKYDLQKRQENLSEATLRAILKTKGIYLPDKVGFYN